MGRRDWWLGILAISAAILLHMLFPRYEWRQAKDAAFVRVDRWSGAASLGWWDDQRRWTAAPRPAATSRAATPGAGASAIPPAGADVPESR
jgi:hypothetical protein